MNDTNARPTMLTALMGYKAGTVDGLGLTIDELELMMRASKDARLGYLPEAVRRLRAIQREARPPSS